jgi:hypothetical protein
MERKDIAKFSNKKLLSEFKSYDSLINIEDCFGTNDVVVLDWLEQEIENRGLPFPSKHYDD